MQGDAGGDTVAGAGVGAAVETTVTMAHANISGLIADSRIIKFVLVIYRRKSARVVLPYTGRRFLHILLSYP